MVIAGKERCWHSSTYQRELEYVIRNLHDDQLVQSRLGWRKGVSTETQATGSLIGDEVND